MFKQPWASQHAVLGYMAHQDEGARKATAGLKQGRGHCPHLAYVAGQAIGLKACEGLHRVYHQQGWRRGIGRFQHILHA